MKDKRREFVSLGAESIIMFGGKKTTPEKMIHLSVLEDVIDRYLCGIYSEEMKYYDKEDHGKARDFIFSKDKGFQSFYYYWNLVFPDINIEMARKSLEDKFRKRIRKWRNGNGADKSDAGRERNSYDCNSNRDSGDNECDKESQWVESLLFSERIENLYD